MVGNRYSDYSNPKFVLSDIKGVSVYEESIFIGA